ncbi:MAG TPA: phosphoglycolate phosphatase [Steroidobacteraceae bacterium]|nr:phosphoglycolate phosphatase [Steroidobacteraceae bacterium]
MIEAVLFDLDGTLLDTAPDMARTVNEMRTRRGLAPVPQERVRPHVSKGARGMLLAAFEMTTDHPEFPAMREEFLRIYGDNLFVDTQVFPGMTELLGRLEASAIAWGVVTNKFERFARPLLDEVGLGARAGVIVGGDTCPKAKPFPEPLLFAAKALGVKPAHTLYVGDDERDVQAARAAGMPIVVAGYGYLGDGPPAILWGADDIIDSPAGVMRWIRSQAPQSARGTVQ